MRRPRAGVRATRGALGADAAPQPLPQLRGRGREVNGAAGDDVGVHRALPVADVFRNAFQLSKSADSLAVLQEPRRLAPDRQRDAEGVVDVQPLGRAPAPRPLREDDQPDVVHLDRPAAGGDDDGKTLVRRGLLHPTPLGDYPGAPRQAGDVHPEGYEGNQYRDD